jgi:sugar lactone lactonase YvrE
VAGNGAAAFGGDNGPATAASLFYPSGIALDRAGNLFIADGYNLRIRRVDAKTGVITTVAGNGSQGYSGDNGPATSASLYFPGDVALDTAGNLFIAEESNHIRRVDAITDIITTVAGNGTLGYNGDNIPATTAGFRPSGVALDDAGNVFIADSTSHRIRRVDTTTGFITTVAGNGTAAYSGDDGPATMASLNYPQKVTVDSAGNLFVSDSNNDRIRRVDAVTHTITTAAGNGTRGFSGDDGSATSAMLNYPEGAAVDRSGNLFIADTGSNRIRQVPLGTSGISLSQNAINFGMVPIYSSPTVIVTITNTGDAAEVLTVVISGSATYTETDTCGTSVATNTSCAVNVTFSPLTLGAETGVAQYQLEHAGRCESSHSLGEGNDRHDDDHSDLERRSVLSESDVPPHRGCATAVRRSADWNGDVRSRNQIPDYHAFDQWPGHIQPGIHYRGGTLDHGCLLG